MNGVPGSHCSAHVPHGLRGSHLLGATGRHKGPHVGWHAQAGRGHIAQADTVLGEQAGQRMHGAPMLQIPHHGDLGEEPNHQEGPQIEHLHPHFTAVSGPGCRPPAAAGLGAEKAPPNGLPLQTSPMQAWSSCCHDPHRHAIDSPKLLPDGEDVQQGLGGMLSDPIPSVNHWPSAVLGCQLGKREQERRALASASQWPPFPA